MTSVTFRPATFADFPTLARLHAQSWQQTYRGLMRDDFLENEVAHERLTVWEERLSQPDPNRLVQMAEQDGDCVGFVCAFFDHDPTWGSYIDNLHVRPDKKGAGIGVLLMREAAVWFDSLRPDAPFYLWVLEGNHGARQFYERLGAVCQERVVRSTPYSPASAELRYCWPDTTPVMNYFRAGVV